MSDYRGRPYNDQKCFFRCLALFQGAKRSNLEKPAQTLLRRFMRKTKKARFEGVRMSDLDVCERVFKVGIEVFEFDESSEPPTLVCLRRSHAKIF